MLIVTAGGWETHYGPRGVNGPIDDLLFPINHGALYYPGYDVLPPFVSYRADRMDDGGFEDMSAALRQRMRALFTDAPIAYRQQNGGDYSIPAMSSVPKPSTRNWLALPPTSGTACGRLLPAFGRD